MVSKVLDRRAWVAVFLCSIAFGVAAQTANFDRTVTVDISSEPLAAALIDFSKQTGIQVITPGSSVKGLSTHGVHGEMAASSALRRLLEGTSLEFHALGPNTIGIDTAAAKPIAGDNPAGSPALGTSLAQLPAQGDARAAPVAVERGSDAPKSSQQPASLDAVIVTAQKREERLQDVPVPVTVIKADSLVDYNQVRLQDLLHECAWVDRHAVDLRVGRLLSECRDSWHHHRCLYQSNGWHRGRRRALRLLDRDRRRGRYGRGGHRSGRPRSY